MSFFRKYRCVTRSQANIFVYIFNNFSAMVKIFKTSMMWPSQNFLLHIRNIIKMKVTEWINSLKTYINPPLWIYIQRVQIITI